MRQIISILILVMLFSRCDDNRNRNPNEMFAEKEFGKKQAFSQNLNLDVIVALTDSNFISCENMKIKVKLTNNESITQRFLFGKPESMNSIRLEIIDSNGNSVIQQHWSELSSKLWFEDELQEFYYELKPNHSIDREFNLTRIAVIRNQDIEGGNHSTLKEGTYYLRVKFGRKYSDIHKFTINGKMK